MMFGMLEIGSRGYVTCAPKKIWKDSAIFVNINIVFSAIDPIQQKCDEDAVGRNCIASNLRIKIQTTMVAAMSQLVRGPSRRAWKTRHVEKTQLPTETKKNN